MGNVGSAFKVDTGEPNFEHGIVFTEGFVAQLDGKQISRRDRPSLPASRRRRDAVEAAVQDRIKLDKELRSAYEQSKLAGDLLLKNEAKEIHQIHQFADDLIKREYSAPCNEVPCQDHKDAVLNCYNQNSQDVLLCSSLVDAYAKCADGAREDWTRSVKSSATAAAS